MSKPKPKRRRRAPRMPAPTTPRDVVIHVRLHLRADTLLAELATVRDFLEAHPTVSYYSMHLGDPP